MLDRLENESVSAYNLFLAYVQCGGDKKATSLITGKTVKALSSYDLKYMWQDRFAEVQNERAKGLELAIREEAGVQIAALPTTQSQIRIDVLVDYKNLLTIWREKVEMVTDIEEFTALIKVREKLDNMARKAVQLPTGYRVQETFEEDTELPDNVELAWVQGRLVETEAEEDNG